MLRYHLKGAVKRLMCLRVPSRLPKLIVVDFMKNLAVPNEQENVPFCDLPRMSARHLHGFVCFEVRICKHLLSSSPGARSFATQRERFDNTKPLSCSAMAMWCFHRPGNSNFAYVIAGLRFIKWMIYGPCAIIAPYVPFPIRNNLELGCGMKYISALRSPTDLLLFIELHFSFFLNRLF